jgi:ketosteroid isomerase-like protein
VGELLEHVRGYYEALNRGDADEVAAFFTDDATHYYTRMDPHHGREIAENAELGVKHIDAKWILEHGIENGEEAVIEWTMVWTDLKSGQRRLDRGTEWFRFDDGKICEVRAYFHSNDKNRSGDLVGFDHAGRGYTTL